MEKVLQKKIDTVSFTLNNVNFDVTYEDNQNWPNEYFENFMTVICGIKIDLIVCEPDCVKVFFVNLLNSQAV